MKTLDEMIEERLTIQEGELKGAEITPTWEIIRELMIAYNEQFEDTAYDEIGYSFETGV